VLRHTFKRTVKVLPDVVIEKLKEPEKFLSDIKTKYIKDIKKISDNKYIITFVWKKFGITKTFNVVFKVIDKGSVIVYKSTNESDHFMEITFVIVEDKDQGVTEINVTAEMEAGVLANLFGKGEFAKFIEDMIDKAIRKHLIIAYLKDKNIKATCDNCVFYEIATNKCYVLNKVVRRSGVPLCGGKYFKPIETRSNR